MADLSACLTVPSNYLDGNWPMATCYFQLWMMLLWDPILVARMLYLDI